VDQLFLEPGQNRAEVRVSLVNAQTAALEDGLWPALPLAAWSETYATLHMWTQIAGKIRLRLCPPANHWWQVTLHVTARGLTTTAMPYGQRTFQIDFDFIDRALG
jgi:hypothetical protein